MLLWAGLHNAACAAAPVAGARAPAALAHVVGRCKEQMSGNICTALNDRSAPRTYPPGAKVYVAGVGALDAESYRRIRAGGAQMCTQVQQACRARPDGDDCKTAFALWGQP